MADFILRKVAPHYEFRLRLKRRASVAVPRKHRRFWARGPQEALEEVMRRLGIKGPLTPEVFAKAGGVWLRMVGGTYKRSQTIYPF